MNNKTSVEIGTPESKIKRGGCVAARAVVAGAAMGLLTGCLSDSTLPIRQEKRTDHVGQKCDFKEYTDFNVFEGKDTIIMMKNGNLTVTSGLTKLGFHATSISTLEHPEDVYTKRRFGKGEIVISNLKGNLSK